MTLVAKWFLLLVVVASWLGLATGCGDSADPDRPSVPEPVAITDINPAPDVVEVNLVAAVGQAHYRGEEATEIWGYKDGSKSDAKPIVPGPMIEAQQGDTVIVHFTNQLPDGTTIHWHGVRVPNASDGTHATQHEIHQGETFDYQFKVDAAGTFWFHPHVRANVQIERGLYAMLIVRGGPEVPVAADRVFILDDVKLEPGGKLSEVVTTEENMIGRQGAVILANGKSGARITTKNGARERWRFINAANSRYFSLKLRGHSFNIIGWDGGIIPEPYRTETILIAPGERYEVLVDLTRQSGELALETIYYFRAHGMPYVDPAAVFYIDFAGDAPAPAPLPDTWGPIPDLPVDATTPVESLVLSETDDVDVQAGKEPQFFINDKAFPDAHVISGFTGDTAIWSVKNDGEMDHPFHLHGMFFKVLDIDGDPPAHAGWKDTINIKHPATLRFAVRYGGPGHWMYHCHILEHAERGMMGELVLSAKN